MYIYTTSIYISDGLVTVNDFGFFGFVTNSTKKEMGWKLGEIEK